MSKIPRRIRSLRKYYIRNARRNYRMITEAFKQEIFPYSHILFQRFYDRFRLRLLKESVSHQSGRILDVGCCDGSVLMIAPDSYHMKIGIDVMLEPLRDANFAAKKLRKCDETEFLLCDAEKISLRENSVDAIVCAELLEHVFDPLAVLEECSRVLRPNGLLILSLPTVPFLKSLMANISRRKVRFRSPFHLREYGLIGTKGVTSLQDLFDDLNSLNLRIIRKNNIGVFYVPISEIARFKCLSKFLETLELKLSTAAPLLFGGVFVLIEAKKIQPPPSSSSKDRNV